jgi:hypothetical protein
MHNKMLLEGIWRGSVTTTQSRFSIEIKRLLKLILPHHIVCLHAGSEMTCGRILPEEIELLPAVSLGDILTEELSTDVPCGSMVVVIKEQKRQAEISKSEVSFQLGLIIGDMLLGIVGDGVFPLQCETEALRMMANSYCRLIENPGQQRHAICTSSFHKGVYHSVSEYWNGPIQTDLSSRKFKEKSLREMVLFGGYLNEPSPDTWTREPSQKCTNLSEIFGTLRGSRTWKKEITRAVLREILPYTSQVYNH